LKGQEAYLPRAYEEARYSIEVQREEALAASIPNGRGKYTNTVVFGVDVANNSALSRPECLLTPPRSSTGLAADPLTTNIATFRVASHCRPPYSTFPITFTACLIRAASSLQ
jgi:hypothetical protein